MTRDDLVASFGSDIPADEIGDPVGVSYALLVSWRPRSRRPVVA